MDVRILDLPSAKVACLRYLGPYGSALDEFWRETVRPWLTENGLTDVPLYGIGRDDPSVTPPEQCRYDACAVVPDGFHASGEATLATVPGGSYAVAKFSGNPATIGAAWDDMFNRWLPASGYQCDARPCFEYYPRAFRFDETTQEFDCDLCIPVKLR